MVIAVASTHIIRPDVSSTSVNCGCKPRLLEYELLSASGLGFSPGLPQKVGNSWRSTYLGHVLAVDPGGLYTHQASVKKCQIPKHRELAALKEREAREKKLLLMTQKGREAGARACTDGPGTQVTPIIPARMLPYT